MPYVAVPKGVNNVTVGKRDTVSFETRNAQGKIIASGNDFTTTYVAGRGTKTRNAGSKVLVGGKWWAPCRTYNRYASTAFWSGISKEVRTISPGAGELTTWQGPIAPSSVWDPRNNSVWGTSTSSVGVTSTGNGQINANGRNRTNTQLLQKAGQRKVNYGESLAEGRQTLSMIANTSLKVLRAFRAVRRGQFGNAARILGIPSKNVAPRSYSVSQAWLSYQYGWTPLLSDIYDTHKLLKNGLSSGPQLFSVKSFWKESASVNNADNFFNNSTTTTDVTVGGKMWFRIADSTLSALNQFGLINPLEIAWAVVPYSFVVDWFVPVGAMLEAFSARVGITFVDGYYGTRTSSRLYKSGWKAARPGNKVVASTMQVVVETFSYDRTRITSLPWPGLYYKSPFSYSHLLSVNALIRTLRK